MRTKTSEMGWTGLTWNVTCSRIWPITPPTRLGAWLRPLDTRQGAAGLSDDVEIDVRWNDVRGCTSPV